MEELLMEKREAREDTDAKKGAECAAKKVADNQKTRIGKERLDASLKRKDRDEEERNSDVDDAPRKKRKAKMQSHVIGGECEVERFAEHMKAAGMARFELE